jgi:hypothetical protein
MRSIKNYVAGLGMALLLTTGAFAGSDLNEVGALLVYPSIATLPAAGTNFVETFVTITNAGPLPQVAHISYINGNATSFQYCYECDFELPLTGNDTEVLVIQYGPTGIHVRGEDLPIAMSCPFPYGMLVVSLEDGLGNTVTDNVLLGEEVVVDYLNGAAYSIPAVPFQGLGGGDGDRAYEFDDVEYGRMPRIVAADFLAPKLGDGSAAVLSLFTLNFDRQFPPLTDCSVTGYDAFESPFSASFQFGCWVAADICAISPEFCWPNLGLFGNLDTHGWLQLNCRVDRERNGSFDANGGVHGAIVQWQPQGSSIAASDTDGVTEQFFSAAAWGRLLYQSVTTGDSVTLTLENPGQGLD